MNEGFEVLHGPGSSAERPSTKRTRKQLEAGKAYWKERIAKLNRQRPEATSSVLRGVVIYFEGYTDDVTSFQLKKLVYSNGGDISHYFSKKQTTHVVCTNLCNSKAQRVNNSRIRVVHPDWIRMSCREGRKLPEDNFLIFRDETIKTIDSFFQRKLAPYAPREKKQKVTKQASDLKSDATTTRVHAEKSVDELRRKETAQKDGEEFEAPTTTTSSTTRDQFLRPSRPSPKRSGSPLPKASSSRSPIPLPAPSIAPDQALRSERSDSKPSDHASTLHPPLPLPTPSSSSSSSSTTSPLPLRLPLEEGGAHGLPTPPPTLPSRPLSPSPPKRPPPQRKPVNREALQKRFSPNKSFIDQFPSADTLPYDD